MKTTSYAPRPNILDGTGTTAQMLRDRPVVILPENAPHPQSHRPDLPLRSELAKSSLEEEHEAEVDSARDEAREGGFLDGYDQGREQGRRDRAAEIRTLETQLADLRKQLEAKAS